MVAARMWHIPRGVAAAMRTVKFVQFPPRLLLVATVPEPDIMLSAHALAAQRGSRQ